MYLKELILKKIRLKKDELVIITELLKLMKVLVDIVKVFVS